MGKNHTQSSNYKATFKYKYLSGYNNEFLVFVYEYSVFENLARGYSVSLHSQHIQNQRRIDSIIEDRNRPSKPVRREDTADYAIDEFLKYIKDIKE